MNAGNPAVEHHKAPRIGLVVGLVVFIAMLLSSAPEGLDDTAWRVAALGVLMAIFWMTEAIPIPATAMLPIPLIPLLNIASVKESVVAYSHPVIFLFMGGFIVALAMERWRFHLRVALFVLRFSGDRPAFVLGGFLVVSAFLSMWVSNTATTLMMLPIAVSVVGVFAAHSTYDGQKRDAFSKALMLSLAYGASAGGMATLVGTPPNAFLSGFAKQSYGIEIGFVDWMLVALPISVLMLVAVWVVLTRVAFKIENKRIPQIKESIDAKLAEQGDPEFGEVMIGLIFLLLAALWISRPWLNSVIPGLALSDSVIAMAVGLSTFLVPVDWRKGIFLMNWEWAKKIPFGILLLFGGGLTLASLIDKSGLSSWIGSQLTVLGAFPTIVLVITMVLMLVLLTELTSNTATTAAFLPLVGALAVSLGDPPLLLVIPATLAASCAFMLPVATPPNAIVFSSGYLEQRDMTRSGFLLNLIGVILVTVAAYSLVLWVFQLQV